jgi:hypothetical protein
MRSNPAPIRRHILKFEPCEPAENPPRTPHYEMTYGTMKAGTHNMDSTYCIRGLQRSTAGGIGVTRRPLTLPDVK